MPQGKHGEDIIILCKLFSPTLKWYAEGRYTHVCGGICYTIGEPITIFPCFTRNVIFWRKWVPLCRTNYHFPIFLLRLKSNICFLNTCTQTVSSNTFLNWNKSICNLHKKNLWQWLNLQIDHFVIGFYFITLQSMWIIVRNVISHFPPTCNKRCIKFKSQIA